MIDALLYAVRDVIRGSGQGYGPRECEIMGSGEPPPRCGNIFVAIVGGDITNEAVENLDEYHALAITLTMRTQQIPLDRVGDQLLALRTAKQNGFNARARKLKSLLNKNWQVNQKANQYLVELLAEEQDQIYGFSEPLIFQRGDTPHFVGPDWFGAAPPENPGAMGEVGIVSQLSFGRARRLQPVGSFS